MKNFDITCELLDRAERRGGYSKRGGILRRARCRETLKDIIDLNFVLIPKEEYEEMKGRLIVGEKTLDNPVSSL